MEHFKESIKVLEDKFCAMEEELDHIKKENEELRAKCIEAQLEGNRYLEAWEKRLSECKELKKIGRSWRQRYWDVCSKMGWACNLTQESLLEEENLS